MLDKFLYKCFGKLDDMIELVSKVFAPRCKCGRRKKNK